MSLRLPFVRSQPMSRGRRLPLAILLVLIVSLSADSPSAADPAASTAPVATRSAAQWPFSQFSPWNHPLGSNADYQVIRSEDFSVNGGVSVNIVRWSHPVFVATESDPIRDIYQRGTKFSQARIRVPEAARPDPEEDSHLHIINPQHTRVMELYKAEVSATGRIVAEWVVENDLHGPGIFTRWHGARAYGGSAIGGLVRRGELKSEIRHALAVAVNGSALNKNGPYGKPYVWPACEADYAWRTHYATRGNLYMGSLLAIPADVDLASIGVGTSGPAFEIARALQNYGAYITDAAGANIVFYVEPIAKHDVPADLEDQLATIITRLHVVANNGPRTIGGGGTPRRPLAPPLKRPNP